MEEPLTTNHLFNKGTNSNSTVAKFGIAADLEIRVSWVRIPPENGALFMAELLRNSDVRPVFTLSVAVEAACFKKVPTATILNS